MFSYPPGGAGGLPTVANLFLFFCFFRVSWQVQYFVDLAKHNFWTFFSFFLLPFFFVFRGRCSTLWTLQVQNIVAGAGLCGDFVAGAGLCLDVEVQISWQVQDFVGLGAQISWQAAGAGLCGP